jgi:hypothetical protein
MLQIVQGSDRFTKCSEIIVISFDVIYFLTAVGLTPGGSSTVHIYTQTIPRTTQSTQTIHRTTISKPICYII